MLNKEIQDILAASKETGWVLEPDAKRTLSLCGVPVPRFAFATSPEEAVQCARKIGFPVVAKVVSPEVLHKSDIQGVVVGIDSDARLIETFRCFSGMSGFRGMLVEEMLSGIELIVGAKIDYQFGPIILLGIGGTGVEIYRDTTVRTAPLHPRDTESMVKSLKARQLLEGYRGSKPVNLKELSRMLMAFSDLVTEIQDEIESVDLNPVLCTVEKCVVADARIILKQKQGH